MEPTPTPWLLREHGRFVRRLARALVRDPHAAEDVAQEAWLQWWRRSARVASSHAWLRRAVRHLTGNRRRADERRVRHERLGARDEALRAPDEEAARSELLQRVVDAVCALDEPYRQTILARYFRGLGVRALAAESGVPPSTVRSRERTALETLRRRLDRACGGRGAWAMGLATLARVGVLRTGPAWTPLALLGAAGSALVVLGTWIALGSAQPSEANGPPSLTVRRTPPRVPRDMQGTATRTPRAPTEAERAAAPAGADVDPELDLLVGETVDPAGSPLAGVSVRLGRSGSELESVRSDEQGRFRIEDVRSFDSVTAELPGYRFLHATDPETDLFEPLEPMRVTLARSGELEVVVRDPSGRPLEGVGVNATPRPEELCGGTESQTLLRQRLSAEGVTDAVGRVRLVDLWSGLHLTLRLDLDWGLDSGVVTLDRELGGVLHLVRPEGRPVVVPPGQRLELTATWGAPCSLRGIALDSTGRPAAGARVLVEDEGYGQLEEGRDLAACSTDEDGSFEVSFRPAGLRGPVRVLAQRSEGALSLGSPPALILAPCAWRGERRLSTVELREAEPLVLTLGPAADSALLGRVQASDGSPVDWAAFGVTVVRPPESSDPRRIVYAFTSGGGFSASPVEPGLHDLVVLQARAFAKRAGSGEPIFATFSGVPAGVELPPFWLPAEAPVRLRIRGPSLGEVQIARRLAGPRHDAPPAAAHLVVRTSAPWSELDERNGGPWWSGGGTTFAMGREELGRATADGSWVVAQDHAGGVDELTLALGDPGVYRFRAECEGRAPLATELLYLEAGEHELRFEPPETGALRGRLLADGTREFFGVQLADARGRALAPIRPLPASGAFRLAPLGCGGYRLRLGSLEELAAGRPRKEVEVEISAGVETELEVDP